MTATVESTRTGRRAQPQFHTLTVASVDRLTDDSAAVTFDVPADLAEAFAFDAGQSLTIRRTIHGAEHRRTYSICAPAGRRPRIGVREIPDGVFSSWLVREVTPGTEIEVQSPTGAPTPRPRSRTTVPPTSPSSSPASQGSRTPSVG